MKKAAFLLAATIAVSACSSQPRVIQASSSSPEIRLTQGIATQIELPDDRRVKNVVVGNPSLVDAGQADNVVNLLTKQGSGETNLIIRSVDEDGNTKVNQYRVIVQAP